jgi:peptidoglycan hydrolase-like protein with peptidoglycan-binding domain
MRLPQLVLLSALIAVSTSPAFAASHARRTAASHSFTKHPAKTKLFSQKSIGDDRATQIQAALIRNGYLTGTPSGHWDTDSEAAMAKLQADNGWQTKLVPDSRAIIKLGLGPTPSATASTPATPITTAQR